MDWEKILANNATKKGLISKICKQLIKLNVENKSKTKTNNHHHQMDRRPI